jgi:hypothetical protein
MDARHCQFSGRFHHELLALLGSQYWQDALPALVLLAVLLLDSPELKQVPEHVAVS